MKIVPQAFYNSSQVTPLLSSESSGLFRKVTTSGSEDNARYLSSHAFTFVVKGGLHIESENGNGINVGRNEMAFLPKGTYMISDLIPEDSMFEAYVLFVAHAELQAFSASLTPSDENTLVTSKIHLFPAAPKLHSFFASVASLYATSSQQNDSVMKSFVAHFLVSLSAQFQTSEFEKLVLTLAKDESTPVEQIVLQNFLKPITVKQLASLCNQSPSTFQRTFKKIFGSSPKKWIVERRLEHAQNLLRQNFTVQDVSFQTGFGDVPHFIRTFEQRIGQTPKQYQLSQRHMKSEAV